MKRDTLDIAVSSASVQNTTKHSTAEVLIDKERRKLSRVREAYEAGVDTLEEYRENKQKILARIKDLYDSIESTPVQTEQERIASVKGKISASLAVLTAPDLSETAKNEALLSFVEKIIFVKPKGVVEIHYKA